MMAIDADLGEEIVVTDIEDEGQQIAAPGRANHTPDFGYPRRASRRSPWPWSRRAATSTPTQTDSTFAGARTLMNRTASNTMNKTS